MTKEEAKEKVAKIADRLENLSFGFLMPIPDSIHVNAMRHQLPYLGIDLKQCYIALFDENPWNEYPWDKINMTMKKVGMEMEMNEIAKLNKAMALLDRACRLVGNPCTNISSSTDMACDQWQEDYAKFLNDFYSKNE